MPAPLDPAVREAIETAIRAGDKSLAQIGRDHQVATSTVSRLSKHLETTEGIDPPSQRSQTKQARAALDEDVALQRADLARLLMVDAFAVRERMWEEQEEYLGSMDGPRRVVRQTNAREFKDFSTAIGILIDKVGVLTRDDTDGLAAVDAWLKSITGIG